MYTKKKEFFSLFIITIINIENLDEEIERNETNENMKRITLRISFIISAGSIELVVFIDHVKRSERGLVSPAAAAPPPPVARLSFVVIPSSSLVLLRSAARRYDADALAILPPIADILFPMVVAPAVVDDKVVSRMDFLDNH